MKRKNVGLRGVYEKSGRSVLGELGGKVARYLFLNRTVERWKKRLAGIIQEPNAVSRLSGPETGAMRLLSGKDLGGGGERKKRPRAELREISSAGRKAPREREQGVSHKRITYSMWKYKRYQRESSPA